MRSSILFAAAPDQGQVFVREWPREPAAFCCVLAHTDTCLVPGLSAAGVSDALRPLTPAADAEVVLLGEALCLPHLPSHPAGAAGPSGITRAALHLTGVVPTFVGLGLAVWPRVPCARLSDRPGSDIRIGQAVPDAADLLASGQALGRELAETTQRLIVAESVPGGTTTALAVLLALGYAADGRVSGSSPGNARDLKSSVAHAALQRASMAVGEGRASPLAAVAALGDPMQPLACGLIVSAVEAGCTVMLAGGSQMVAVAALIEALGRRDIVDGLAIATTRWVVQDQAADVPGLVREVSPRLPLLAADLNFSTSRHATLRPYEDGLVKEGVGAGGAAVTALLSAGVSRQRLHAAIETTYDRLLGRLD